MSTTSHIGLREQIANAATQEEIVELLKKGADLQNASDRTRLSWKYTAHRRLQQLQKTSEPVASSSEPVNKPTKPKKVSKKK